MQKANVDISYKSDVSLKISFFLFLNPLTSFYGFDAIILYVSPLFLFPLFCSWIRTFQPKIMSYLFCQQSYYIWTWVSLINLLIHLPICYKLDRFKNVKIFMESSKTG